jgi:predicted restriction endonuclease
LIPSDIPKNTSGDISVTDAKKYELRAGFSDEIFGYLKNNPKIVQRLIGDIIEDNFSETLHETLLETLGIDNLSPLIISTTEDIVLTSKAKRDPKFRGRILALYDYRCAFCNYKIYFQQYSSINRSCPYKMESVRRRIPMRIY